MSEGSRRVLELDHVFCLVPRAGPHRLTLTVDGGTALAVTDLLALAA